ncbi:MAG TPA: ABC transporter permease subunit [Capsulimonadaceae bacterium]|nr:ABC transporter permease subunit [Capsulimonadaceae bacterium]
MALLPAVGRRSPKGRLFIALLYLVLSLGAVTTVYPFLVMLGDSVASEFDQDQNRVIPTYLTSATALFGKYADDKYNGDINLIGGAYNANYAKFQSVTPPRSEPGDSRQVAAWRKFFAALPPDYRTVGFLGTAGQYAPAPLVDTYRHWLRARFHENIHALDQAYTEEDSNFLTVYPPTERPLQRLYRPGASAKQQDWAAFKATLPLPDYVPVLADPLYQGYLRDQLYAGKIGGLNSAWGTKFTDWTQVMLPPTLPTQPGQARDWTQFIRTKMPLHFLKLAPAANTSWEAFLANRKLAPAPLPTPGALPVGVALQAYSDFIRQIDPHLVTAINTENLWRADQHQANATLPLAQDDWAYVQAHAGPLRRGFLARNYLFALNYLLLHGRGVLNTVIYCGGAVLVALIVNPLCAYALSRFRLPWASSVLLFLLATMAFPAEVALIPNFLLLKQLGLLNTFWALILPGAASGFSIFLLKGFFDSLPKELYEAGMLDGAGEATLFRNVTFPLARPIFAVIALQTFTAAYGAFIFAMVVCQAQSHWTMMVWIYQFQALGAPQFVMMAALVLAALPTLIVFLFAQNVIMKGIILPSFK